VIPHAATTPAIGIANATQNGQTIVDRVPGIAVADLLGGGAMNAAVATVFG
jgi:hypothetical protein